ncbi:hypothetical protein AB0L00_43350 [Actinoallomurus sp. NPDC052308]|uniref:hypothetical protein n=1 Tax=Actinoallomurus sp. NPDC052308 TaxID=3155530 RepID=UPI0034368F37
MVWDLAIAIVAGLAVLWFAVIAALWLRAASTWPSCTTPCGCCSTWSVFANGWPPTLPLPRSVRIRLWLLLAYLLLPIDLRPGTYRPTDVS